MLGRAITGRLSISFERSGPARGFPVMLVHGLPDSLRCWDKLLPALHNAGYETIVPELRGYGATTFLDISTPRSGETAALARDLLDLADALELGRFALAGHDWGTRALFDACILDPDRVTAAVALSLGWRPAGRGSAGLTWQQRQAFWYQWYLATPHGAQAFKADPDGFCRRLWDTWSPDGWYAKADWDLVRRAFTGPDWCDVVIHYYRARWGQAEPDPAYAVDSRKIAATHVISVPTMIIHGAADGCCLLELSDNCGPYFPAGYAREILDGIGHFPQREAPDSVAGLMLGWLAAHQPRSLGRTT